jgi:EAL domain-containing protein (putative c-di-GMP-specific phosphodiesterase class I)
MREKPCPKCEILPKFPEVKVNVVIFSSIDFLIQKVAKLLSENNFSYILLQGQILIPEVNMEKLISTLANQPFSEAEKEDLKVGFLTEGENLFSVIPRLRPLSVYSAILRYTEYLEILEMDRLTVYFHPVVNLERKEVYGFECLIRGVKRNGEILSPSYLFEAARATDTLFFLDRSCREVSVKTAAVKGLKNHKIFINFLPTVIYDPVFCLQNTIKWAFQLEWNPENLVFEVVETEKVKDFEHLNKILEYYRKHGFKTALDDVGTGFSSLEALIKLQPNYIKISRELIEGLDQSPIKLDLTKALIQAVSSYGIGVIAEGVERIEEAKTLYKLGVKLMQGFLFAKPHPEPIYQLDFSWLNE